MIFLNLKLVKMPKTCVRKCPGGVTMYKFPSQNEMSRRLQWMRLLGVPKSTQKKELYVCERHFSPRYRNIRKLSKGAIPDKNLVTPMVPLPSHHQQPKNVFLRRDVSEHIVISEHRAISEYKFDEEHLCRLCGELQQNVISLYGEDREDFVKLVTLTLGYLNIEFTDKDVFPKWLCATCHVHAELTNKFLLMVQEAQIKLREVVQAERETCRYLITELQENNQVIKLESDCLQSPQNLRKHEIFAAKKIEGGKADTQTSMNDSDTAYIKTEEDFAIHFSTMVRNKLQKGPDLNSHNDLQHRSTPQQQALFASNNDTDLYQCHYCGATYKNEHLLNAHLAKHLGKLYFKCNKCTKRFAHNDELTLHMRAHEGDQSSVNEHYRETSACPSNSNQLAQKYELQASTPNATPSDSSLSRTAEKLYNCTICLKKYAHEAHLKAHQNLKHKNISFPFKCAVCWKPFEFKYLLNRHLRVHDNEKPHECPLCPQKFFLKAQLKSHISLNHENYKEPIEASQLVC